jgi:hypothetical protein
MLTKVDKLLNTSLKNVLLSSSKCLTRTSLERKSYPNVVTIVEVGPRDGLQNEKVNFCVSISIVY